MVEGLSEIRSLTQEEIPQLNTLVSEAFGYEEEHTFFDDFPIWESNSVQRLGIFSAEKLIAHVGIRFCEMKLKNKSKIKIAMVGAVATQDDFRGQGLSTKLLSEAIQESEKNNCDWTILWGSEHEFYSKFGFVLAGEQIQAPLNALEGLPENKIPHIKRGYTPQIFDHLQNSDLGIILEATDRTWVENHKSVNWFYREQPFAFVAFERGLDLHHTVHEYGGDTTSLKELFAFVLSLDHEAQVLGTPESLLELGFDAQDFIEEFLCLARPHSQKPNLVWQPDYWVSGLSAC